MLFNEMAHCYLLSSNYPIIQPSHSSSTFAVFSRFECANTPPMLRSNPPENPLNEPRKTLSFAVLTHVIQSPKYLMARRVEMDVEKRHIQILLAHVLTRLIRLLI